MLFVVLLTLTWRTYVALELAARHFENITSSAMSILCTQTKDTLYLFSTVHQLHSSLHSVCEHCLASSSDNSNVRNVSHVHVS